MAQRLTSATGSCAALAIVLIATPGCTGPSDSVVVSSPFELRALAQGTAPEGPALRCGASFIVEQQRRTASPPGERRWTANAGGDLGKAGIGPDGTSSEAVADWAGTARVRVIGDSVESRFEVGSYYNGDGVTFAGRLEPTGASGRWSCRGTRFRSFDPLALDTLPGIPGTWRLRRFTVN